MSVALRKLLENVFDYAGLFPPAALSMEETAKNYSQYLRGSDQWIVNRLVCPIPRLTELVQFLPDDSTWGITVIGTGVPNLKSDMAAVREFEHASSGRALVECYETKVEDLEAIRSLARCELEETYAEIPLGDDVNEWLHTIAEFDNLGAKARTGGLSAEAFPRDHELSDFLLECLHLDLPHKLTAGLHHPFRTVDTATGALAHGFLNVMIAGVLASAHELTRSEIVAILGVEDPGHFRLEHDSVGWTEWDASIEDIEDYRCVFTSIGSCSIEEPLSDLENLNLLSGSRAS